MTIREQTELFERQMLSPLAARAGESRGRDRSEPQCELRTVYQRDRDRILHCNAFRRLMQKTQMLLSPEGDHYRTRLTHTLEVSQIARTIARGLRLNEDLTEAIALGHDLGHTPFGHAGERVLNEVCTFGYRHYEQSVRVVERLEKDGEGLNLTYEVRNGIACHTTGHNADTLEGQAVRVADKIAYLNHDIEDAIRAGILSEENIPWQVHVALGNTKTQRITTLVKSTVHASAETVEMDPETADAFALLHKYMFATVYVDPVAKGEEHKAEHVVKALFGFYMQNPDRLPEGFRRILELDGQERAVCDYISGMSDRYATAVYNDIYVPRPWKMALYD
ncbi:MAG: deoxyguanosinetriphosphate triphosphohydrolase [Acetanaerobacterium sp.]